MPSWAPGRLAALAALALAGGCLPRPRPAGALAAELSAALRGFHGQAAVYARRLPAGEEAAVRPDESFPTASLIKVPIVAALLESLESGATAYGAQLVYSSTRAYADEDLLAHLVDGSSVTLSRLAYLTLSFSDNTAALWLQELAGGGAGVNAWLEREGFSRTRVNSRTPGREADRQAFGWGQTTPRELAELMARIRLGRLVSPAASDRLLRLLSGSFWDGEALSQLPPYVHAASKQGAVSASRSEAVVVEAPAGPYVFCVMTRGNEDQGWERGNEAFELIRRVSRLLWERWGGGEWSPPAGQARYYTQQ